MVWWFFRNWGLRTNALTDQLTLPERPNSCLLSVSSLSLSGIRTPLIYLYKDNCNYFWRFSFRPLTLVWFMGVMILLLGVIETSKPKSVMWMQHFGWCYWSLWKLECYATLHLWKMFIECINGFEQQNHLVGARKLVAYHKRAYNF